MRKIILTFVVFLFLLILPHNVSADNFYVQDNANILSNEIENYITTKSTELESETKAQIVVVTVKSLEGSSIEDYATKLFRDLKIGDEKENNGLLLLLSLEERQFRVEVGYGFEGILTDGLTGRYQDEYMIPYFKNNDWDNGIKNGYDAFYKKIASYYQIGEISQNESENLSDKQELIFKIIVLIITTFIIMAIITFGGPFVTGGFFGSGRYYGTGGFFSGGSSFGGRGSFGGGGSSGGGGSTRRF